MEQSLKTHVETPRAAVTFNLGIEVDSAFQDNLLRGIDLDERPSPSAIVTPDIKELEKKAPNLDLVMSQISEQNELSQMSL